MRLNREDWSAGGFELLKDRGGRALTIDGLCARLGITKGSFYHTPLRWARSIYGRRSRLISTPGSSRASSADSRAARR